MVNKIILIGNVGKDPEVKYLNNGVPVARLTLATTESYKDQTGNKVSKTEWHNIVFWRGLAEVVEKYVKKGHSLYIEGKLTYNTLEGQDGTKRYFTEIVANEMKMLTRAGSGSGGAEGSYTKSEPAGSSIQESEPPMEADDLPF